MRRIRFAAQIIALVTATFALAGCGVLWANPTVSPTEDTVQLQATIDQAQTQAVQTLAAELTALAPVASDTPAATNTPTATETSLPTNTLAPSSTSLPTATTAPSITPLPPTATRVVVLSTNTPSASATPNTITCALSEVSPEAGADYKPGDSFDAAWTIKNTGSTTWSASEVDIRYLSGTKMHEGDDNRDLPVNVAPNESFRYIFDMIAPSTAGRHSETWVLTRSGETLCILTATIDVVP